MLMEIVLLAKTHTINQFMPDNIAIIVPCHIAVIAHRMTTVLTVNRDIRHLLIITIVLFQQIAQLPAKNVMLMTDVLNAKAHMRNPILQEQTVSIA